MARAALRGLLICGLIGIGWVAGRAQGTGPDFVITIDAPEGKTNIECVSGCRLAWIERMEPATVNAQSTTFWYGCSNSRAARCSSGRIGGWIKR
jgi:hypothetical protein